VYDLSKSPWAINMGQGAILSQASIAFNTALLTTIVDLGANVLYVDAAYYFNLMANQPAVYSFTNSTAAACVSLDVGPGIGIGNNQVNSSLCTTSTIAAGIDYKAFLFADNLYVNPVAHRLFGDYAAARMRSRW
jgi:phospholipase/lecithinase/hemolysin